ncbi:phosphatidylserine decarboxylase [Pneumocystis carinii B80]|uniref:Phosphatidylserine decarboxylase proenzyme 1, mitochondrial n=1 Tax=Pneumocystis carinii (strain B80) TaxID=1408658 RepID=A0A0W4ZG86_PNEC8|nr:phosphatidylserine decarboxylase [Pneumocystis carinii B80]KTW27405.1 phosphatidylserine decarboxylase [Pneumocystis carinii B80]
MRTILANRYCKRLVTVRPIVRCWSKISSGQSRILSILYGSRRFIGSKEGFNGLWGKGVDERWNYTKIQWYSIPLTVGIVYVVFVHYRNVRKKYKTEDVLEENDRRVSDDIHVCGFWQFYILRSLPLKALSRIWGKCSEITLPIWMRVPAFKFYAWVFGCNLYEMAEQDLRKVKNFSEFFYRELKPGVREIDNDALIVSPADGKVLHFGLVEGRRIEQVKGLSYSLDALIGDSSTLSNNEIVFDKNFVKALEEEMHFSGTNGISHSHMLYNENGKKYGIHVNIDNANKIGKDIILGYDIMDRLKEGNSLYFAVIYLSPGDYHRFHSPTNWVVEKRRYFSGELYSVSPYFAKRITNLFILNERVVLLGQYRYGFMSMIPVGATNVGSIRIDFDKDFKTNVVEKNAPKGTYTETTYSTFSDFLKGYPLRIGQQMGGFNFGSTIILIFEAPQDFEFLVSEGSRILMGQCLGRVNNSKVY